MPNVLHVQKVTAHADRTLREAHEKAESPAELLQVYKSFLKKEEHRIRLAHKQCALHRAGGLEVSAKRAATLDITLHNLFDSALKSQASDARIALMATGGYGRGYLNPGSDIDLQFLHPGKVTTELKGVIESVLYMLYDVGFKVGHAVRSLKETFDQANANSQTKTSLIDARFLAGERPLFLEFERRFRKECIDGQQAAFLESRRQDLIKRHTDHFNTFLVKEPHIKNGCGGLRDFHNILWIAWVKTGAKSIQDLIAKKLISDPGGQELLRAYDFLMLVRNDLHYAEKKSSDALTLRAQGIVAKNFNYPGRRITQKTDAFMRDYYHHTRNVYQHNLSLMERFELELEKAPKPRLLGILTRRSKQPAKEKLDGFIVENSFLYPESSEIFQEDSNRLMILFQHCQLRHLRLSPELRTVIRESYPLINKTYQYKKANRETFEAILSRRGDVARTLRLMHRVGVLGRYLPEFGALTDLVQHEFFHRFTADEHTLQTIEKLDELSDSANPKTALQQQLFHNLDDPFVLYLALIMHDTGRGAENVRHHEWASESLTDQVCRRLQVSPKRRKMLMFLVGHHLTFWHTATTRDIDDPSVIADFARIVRSKEWLDALFLMTYADASATYEHGWSDWKESLLRRLYQQTTDYFQDQAAFQTRTQQPGAELRLAVEKEFDASYSAEIAAHFSEMPERYFRIRDAERLVDHIRLFRKFFRQLAKDDPAAALTPVVKWTARPEQGCSEVTLVSWDRHLLLAKIAGALAASNINILSADVFLRKDNIVLDIFRVCTTSLEPVTAEKTFNHVQSLIERSFSGEDVDFPALIQRHTAPANAQPPPDWQRDFPTRVYVGNDLHKDYTMVEIQAVDRIGLLYAIFQAIGSLGLDITHARINTERGAAIDSFCVVGDFGQKLNDPARLEALRHRVCEAVGIRGEDVGHISG